MLTIGLDTRPLEEGFKAHYGRGIGRYTGELIAHLLKGGETSGAPTYKLVEAGSNELGVHGWKNKLLSVTPAGKVTLETQLILPWSIAQLGVDLFHFFAHGDAPAWSSVPYVVTVLDLIPLRFPELYKADRPTWRYHFARFLEYRAIARATGILAISESTKKDLQELLGVAEEKIRVTPLAVGSQFRRRIFLRENWENDIRQVRQNLGIAEERPLLLYVGGIDARKNITFLIEVFSEVVKNHPGRGSGQGPVLVMAGKYEGDHSFAKLEATIKNMALEEDVLLPGFVADDILAHLYRGANITLFPSLYEGFGFPVLESMASGVPVIAGNNSSLSEVAGDAALLLDTDDKESWVKEILALLLSPPRQQELGRKGVVQAAKFSWEKTAAATLRAYEDFARLAQTPQVADSQKQEREKDRIGVVGDGVMTKE